MDLISKTASLLALAALVVFVSVVFNITEAKEIAGAMFLVAIGAIAKSTLDD